MIWQLLAIAVCAGVMAAPDLLRLTDAVADAFHILGPIGVSVGAMAASAVLRPLRRLYLVVGPAIGVAPLLLGGGALAIAVGIGAGIALVALAFPGGSDGGQFGGGWASVFGEADEAQ